MSFKSLFQFRGQLNTKLQRRLFEHYGESYFASEIFKRIEKGRKIRSLLFLTTARSLGSKEENVLLDICLSIEMSHAASVLVDDILDGDDIRHGAKSSQASLGTPTATLQSHFLCAEAIQLATSNHAIVKELLTTYRHLTRGEMYDVFLPQPIEQWVCKGYGASIYQKTSALFEYSLVASALVANRKQLVPSVRHLGLALGKLYQFSNDYYDLQPHNLRKRHSKNEAWPVTFSLPLALFLERQQTTSKIAPFLHSRTISYASWIRLLKIVWTPEVLVAAKAALDQCATDAVAATDAALLPEAAKKPIKQLISLVVKEDFWYHDYASI